MTPRIDRLAGEAPLVGISRLSTWGEGADVGSLVVDATIWSSGRITDTWNLGCRTSWQPVVRGDRYHKWLRCACSAPF